jgi:hypothetical protein
MRRSEHIRQRSSGSFELRYGLGTNPTTGKRRVATTTVKGNHRAAEKELRRLLRTLDTGEHVDPSRITVCEWLTTWLTAVREEVAPKSHERYAEIVRNFLAPALGNMPLHKPRQPDSRSIQCLGEWRPGATAKKAASSGSASFRECWNCHEPFVAGPKGNRRGDAKFCSDKCRIEFNSLQRSRKDR